MEMRKITEVDHEMAFIDNEMVSVESAFELNDHYNSIIMTTKCGRVYTLFPNSAAAGRSVRNYYQDMIYKNPKLLIDTVGVKNLLNWGMRRLSGPGKKKVRSLEDWLCLIERKPEEFFARKDRQPRHIYFDRPILRLYKVAYRSR